MKWKNATEAIAGKDVKKIFTKLQVAWDF